MYVCVCVCVCLCVCACLSLGITSLTFRLVFSRNSAIVMTYIHIQLLGTSSNFCPFMVECGQN